MRKIEILFNEYGESHQNQTNKLIHYFCVPLIFWSAVALISSIPSGNLQALFGQVTLINWATLALLPVLIYYFVLSRPLAIGMLLFAVICLATAFYVDQFTSLWKTALVVFAVCWVLQFRGHAIEGKKPSFLKDMQFLLIGPAWILSMLYDKAGIRR